MRTANIRPVTDRTHNGAPVSRTLTDLEQLERAVYTCMLWEKEFYESGTQVADRIKVLTAQVEPSAAAEVAYNARTKYKLRHAPLWVLNGLLDHSSVRAGKYLLDSAIAEVIQRPDEMAELLSLYWKDGKKPLPNQLKKGLAQAFGKFNEYSLAKFDKPGTIRLRDVMFLCHPKPSTPEREALYKRIANNEMVTPDTWETQLSAGANKHDTFVRLIGERKLGADALLKNLRNMEQAGVHRDVIRTALLNANVERILPFRFITAARYAKQFEPELEQLMFKCLEGSEGLKGSTTLLIDDSGSMHDPLSAKSELTRFDAACGLAMLVREVCKDIRVFTFNTVVKEIPARRGFALREALGQANGGGTLLGKAVAHVNRVAPSDRLIVITDEQSSDPVGGPHGKGYMINVATYDKTVGYGPWMRISGWSEHVVDFMVQEESR